MFFCETCGWEGRTPYRLDDEMLCPICGLDVVFIWRELPDENLVTCSPTVTNMGRIELENYALELAKRYKEIKNA